MSDIAVELTRETLRICSIALDVIPQGVIIAGKDGNIVYVNEAFLSITGYRQPDILGRNCSVLQGALTDPNAADAIRHALAECGEFAGEILNYRKDGSVFWNEMTITPVRNEHGMFTHFIGTTQDVSARRRAEQAVRDSEQRLQLALLGGNLALWDWRVDDGCLTVNPRWLAMLGLSQDGPLPTIASWTALVHPEDRPKLDSIVENIILNPEGRDFEVELRARHINGKFVWILDKGAVVERAVDGTPLRVSGTHLDITERKEAEEQMHRLAYYDALTGLPNRCQLLDDLSHALADAQRSMHIGALLFIDLDNFKQINDARGHLIGDTLLQQVAHRISALVQRPNSVARLGGDEFVMLASAMHDDIAASRRTALRLAEQVHEALMAPFSVDGLTYNIGGSIGITLFPKAGDCVDGLLREADTAMYCAKGDRGGAHIAFFETTMYHDAERRLSMEHDLKKALAYEELNLHVESKVDRGKHEVGGELLLRWTHPLHGAISPAQFIPIAEASGLIRPIGNWVIEQACRGLAQLRAYGSARTLSVNVSPRQFLQDGFVEQVRDTLQRTGALANQLIFEVTEGILIENWDSTVTRMEELVALGIRFSIDDFGTGYSSLAYLKRLPIYELKIDRSFVHGIPEDVDNQAIVQAIFSIARHFGLHVVAEGVETAAQRNYLAASACECMQGYLFGQGVPLDAWLERPYEDREHKG
jgi:diguanylate cyclase (GGDEF)-like protein/PAS domain S-box-containing protein